jgi:hypothetical protein
MRGRFGIDIGIGVSAGETPLHRLMRAVRGVGGHLWLDDVSATSQWMTTDAAGVNTWAPRVGTGNLTQGTDAAKPSRVLLSNGRGAVRFDGVGDYMTANALSSLASGDCTMWLAFRMASVPAALNTLCGFGDSSSTNPYLMFACSAGGNLQISARNLAGTSLSNGIVPADTDAHVACVEHTATSMSAHLDGVQIASLDLTSLGAIAFDRFAIGALLRATPSFFSPVDVRGLAALPLITTEATRNQIGRDLAALTGTSWTA